jgi:membrane protein involved in colicin uptake
VVLIGLLLILIAIAAAAWLVIGTQSLTTPIDLDTPGFHVSATPLALLIAGAAVLVVLWLGLAAIRGSVKRRRRPGREAREAQRQAEFEENIRADERARAEETHQGVMAERDRVREDEFSAKLGEHDRIRDADERTRLAEHEQRVRADERARVEEEHSRRNAEAARAAAAGAGGRGLAGAGASSVGGADDAGAAVAGRHEGQADVDGHASDEVYDQHSDRDATPSGTSDPVSELDAPDGDAPRADTSAGDASPGDGGPNDESDAEGNGEGDRFRTVADRVMGRAPTGRD